MMKFSQTIQTPVRSHRRRFGEQRELWTGSIRHTHTKKTNYVCKKKVIIYNVDESNRPDRYDQIVLIVLSSAK